MYMFIVAIGCWFLVLMSRARVDLILRLNWPKLNCQIRTGWLYIYWNGGGGGGGGQSSRRLEVGV